MLGGILPLTPIVDPASSSSDDAVPGLRIRLSMAVRPSTSTATRSASLAVAKSTTSLNEPPEANSASPAATIG